MNLSEHLPQLSPTQIAKLEQLADLFLEWNSKLNLSAIRDRDGVLLKHIIDSLLILPYHLFNHGDTVLDLGTGGGFPGLALAIAYPTVRFTLVDATEKKIRAVEAMAKELGLQNVRCLSGRAEELARKRDMREHFDVVVARALAGFSTLLEYTLPFVKVGGHFIAYQGPELAEECQQYSGVAKKLGGKIVHVHMTQLPIEGAKRCFIVIKKEQLTPPPYPRQVGMPKKNPLE